MPEKPDALVVTCTDSRLHRADRPFLAEYLHGKYVGIRTWDLVALPGGCRGFVAADARPLGEALRVAVKTAHDRHGVTRVLLVNHADCEAYGGAAAFPDATEEYRAHAADLRAAREALRAFLPNLDLRLFYASIEDRADGPFVTLDEVR